MKRSVFSVCIVAVSLLRFTDAASSGDTVASHRRTSGPPLGTGPLRAVGAAGRHRSIGSPRTDARPAAPPLPDAVARRACVALLVALATDPAAANGIPDPVVRAFVSVLRAAKPVAQAVILPRILERWSANVHALCSAASTTEPPPVASRTTPAPDTSSATPRPDTSSTTPRPDTSSTTLPPDASSTTPPPDNASASTPPSLVPLFVPWYAEHRAPRPAIPISSFPRLFRVDERP